ncbi:MAG: sulfotransferase domain-containing protein [Nitrospirae bacterium]|nr:sulfotransferase domain-containing protein [Nitrospirota bacterium]
MVLISGGMPKSGSAYIFNLLNDLFILSGDSDVRQIKRKYKLDKTLRDYNCNIGKLTPLKLLLLILLSKREGPFVVKTHIQPTKFVETLIKLDFIKAIYIYRDPRDALLSAVDHGKRILQKGENHTFAGMVDFENAFEAVQDWIKVWEKWNGCRGVYLLRYENLVNNPVEQMKLIANYLNYKVSSDHINTMLKKYNKNNLDEFKESYLHFNKGVSNRYRQDMSDEHKMIFKEKLGEKLIQMGYHTD